MERKEAVAEVAIKQLREYPAKERKEQLEVMFLEDWTEAAGWDELPADIRKEFEGETLLHSSDDARYDPVLLIAIHHDLLPASNEYLKKELEWKGEIIGKPLLLHPCPCCGRRTIHELGDYDICKVCWWEDDGQDNHNLDRVGGPNYSISLRKARYNFIKYGIYDPARKDLFEHRMPPGKYQLGRQFELSEDGIVKEIE